MFTEFVQLINDYHDSNIEVCFIEIIIAWLSIDEEYFKWVKFCLFKHHL